jgi:hypothetical protein
MPTRSRFPAAQHDRGTVGPGGLVTTLYGSGPTISDPLATTVQTPTGGPVSITEHPIIDETKVIAEDRERLRGAGRQAAGPQWHEGRQCRPPEVQPGPQPRAGIFAAGSPSSQAVTCNTSVPLDDLEQTVTAGASSLSHNAATDT